MFEKRKQLVARWRLVVLYLGLFVALNAGPLIFYSPGCSPSATGC